MQRLSLTEQHLIEAVDPAPMLAQVQAWSALNTGTGNLPGLAEQARLLADAFAELPGDVRLIEPDPVTAIAADGTTVAREHGRHLVLSVRPQARRRLLLTGHMDTVFPADHPFQHQAWLDETTLNGPGVADMKGGIAVILAALTAFESSPASQSTGYDVLINSDEETGSLSSAPLIAGLPSEPARLAYRFSARPVGMELSDVRYVTQPLYALTLFVVTAPRLTLRVVYDRKRYAGETIRALLSDYRNLLLRIAENPEQRVTSMLLGQRA